MSKQTIYLLVVSCLFVAGYTVCFIRQQIINHYKKKITRLEDEILHLDSDIIRLLEENSRLDKRLPGNSPKYLKQE